MTMGVKAQRKHDIMNVIADSNVSTSDIAKVLNYTPEHVSRLRTQAKKNQLLTRKRIKNAIKTVDYFISNENYQGDNRIKPSDALNATRIVLDRAFPVESINTNINFNLESSIDLEKYRLSNTSQMSSESLQTTDKDVIDVIVDCK